MSPRRFTGVPYGTTGTLPNFLAARNNVEPEEIQANPSEKRQSPSRRVSAAFNATAINTYSVIGICVGGVLVLQCGHITEVNTDAIRHPGEDVCCASEPTSQPTPCAPTHRNMIGVFVGN